MTMQPRLNIVTLGVSDLDRSRAFYEKGLGWRVSPASQGDIVFFQLVGIVLALGYALHGGWSLLHRPRFVTTEVAAFCSAGRGT